MSNGGGLQVWVSDLDGYINIGGDFGDDDWSSDHDNEREAEELRLQAELEEIGSIPLFAGNAVSAQTLSAYGIPPSQWRWATHQAEHALQDHQQWKDIEAPFVKEMISMGKRYAVSRYSKWERISYPAALTATFPLGFKALIDQYMSSENISGGAIQKSSMRSIVRIAATTPNITAYHRTGMIRSAIHQLAQEVFGSHLGLSKDGMRTILSLARLHYSVAEIGVGSLRKLQVLDDLYKAARLQTRNGVDRRPPVIGRQIKNWELRFLHPLTHLYPYSIRRALARGMQRHAIASENQTRTIAVNELALARCSILLMRGTRDAPKSR